MTSCTDLNNLSHKLLLATAIVLAPGLAIADSFFKLDNPGDAQFNQLLGINNHKIIAGYFGDGNTVPNNGYLLVPNTHYSVENFTGTPPSGLKITQTQAIGINNKDIPVIVGFWQDQNGVQYGWTDKGGTFTTILDPHASAQGTNQNLLGVNNSDEAAGFWVDSNGNEHGFVVNLDATPTHFVEIPPQLFKGGLATQASGINNNHIVCGFWTDKNNNQHGFFGELGHSYNSFDVNINGKQAQNTQALGCSNNYIAGSYTDIAGAQHGFRFDGSQFQSFDALGSSQKAAFGIAGTVINGVNDKGDLVGFFSDGQNINGFARFEDEDTDQH